MPLPGNHGTDCAPKSLAEEAWRAILVGFQPRRLPYEEKHTHLPPQSRFRIAAPLPPSVLTQDCTQSNAEGHLLPRRSAQPQTLMNSFTVRPLLNDNDWQAAMAVRATLHPEFPLSIEEYKASDDFFDGKTHLRRLICQGDEIVGMYVFAEAFFYAEPKTYLGQVVSFPDRLDVFRFGYSEITRLSEQHEARLINSSVEDRREEIVAIAQEFGYKTKQQQRVSRLDVAQFNLVNEDLEFEILSLNQLKLRWPETWLHEFWRMEMEILKDVPMTGEFKEDPIDLFEKYINMPGMDHDGLFLAIVEGRLAGVSSMFPSLVDSKVGITGLTGVRREFRRLGIARALKIASLNWGKEKGVEFVMTDNEEKNPMYLLNEALGFKPVFNQLVMVWDRAPSES